MELKNKPGRVSAFDPGKAKIATIFGGAIIVFGLLWAVFALLGSLDFSSIIFSFGKNLRVDEYGHTNILLAGIGGEGHDGADLTDTIMVASIDYDHKKVAMLSIPRDLYVKSKNITSGSRINNIYAIGKSRQNSAAGMEDLKMVASEIVGIPIDYFIKVDFNGFKKIVDSLGGVDLVVEKDLYDPEYPLGETTRYETFSLGAGPQHLNGETALKYARSRKTTSDFDRAHRQQQLLSAIREKALRLSLLTDAGKIKDLYDALHASIETDLAINEIIELAKIGKEFGKESIVSRVLSDSFSECGGFLYPPAKENFGGASVLLPAGNSYDFIHDFTKFYLQNPVLALDQSPLQVLNGTKIPNLAGEVMNSLSRNCLNIVYYGNAKNRSLPLSTIYYQPGPKGEKPQLTGYLSKSLSLRTQAGIPPEYLNNEKKQGTIFVIELGADYLQKRIKDPFASLPYLLAPTPNPTLENRTGQPGSAATTPPDAKTPATTKTVPSKKTK